MANEDQLWAMLVGRDRLVSRLRMVRSKLDQVEMDWARRLELILQLQRDAAEMHRRLQEIEADRALQVNAVKRFQDENAVLRQRIEEIAIERESLLGRNAAQQEEIGSANGRINQIEADREARLKVVYALQSDNAALRQRLDEVEADLEARLRVILGLQEELGMLRQGFDDCSRESDARLARAGSAQAENSSLKERIEEFDIERIGLLKRIQDMQQYATDQRRHIVEAEKNSQIHQELIQELRSAGHAQSEKISQLTADLASQLEGVEVLRIRLASVEISKAEVTAGLADCGAMLANVEIERDRLRVEAKDQRRTIQALQDRDARVREALDTLPGQVLAIYMKHLRGRPLDG
jgi:chromosome segregation ATPase